jgi:low temperature requirement protein LtrA
MINAAMLRELRMQLWQPPRPHGAARRDRVVGPLELFYDLVVVALIGQAAHHLTGHLTARGVVEFAVVFTIVWIAWLNGTLLHDLHGREDVRGRNSFMGQILLLVPLGAAVPAAGGRHGRAVAVTAAMLFLLLAYLWWRVSQVDTPEFARPTRLYTAITLVLAAGFVASVPLGAGARLVMWACLAAGYLGSVAIVFHFVPGQLGEGVTVTESLIERFSLLVIIVLGETVTGVVSGLTADPTSGRGLAVGIICVLAGFGAWWTYFDFVGHRSPHESRSATFSWLLSHLPVTAAITGMGASMPRLIDDAGLGRTPAAPTWMFCGSAMAVLLFTTVLMTSLEVWHSAADLLRPIAAANLVAAAVALGVAVTRPAPLVLCLLLVLVFAGPWTFAVLRKAVVAAAVGNEVMRP